MRSLVHRASPVVLASCVRLAPLRAAAAVRPAVPVFKARSHSTATISPAALHAEKEGDKALSQKEGTAAVAQKEGKDVHVAEKALLQQADTGVGAQMVVPSVDALRAAGTIDVTIDGQSAEASISDSVSSPSINRPDKDWTLMHPIWKNEYVHRVTYTHLPPQDFVDRLALNTIRAIRFNFDWMSGYSFGKLTEKKALTRIVFLETVAGVPGSVAGTLRHLASLRRMKRDGGWINTLLAESENERMHLLTFLNVRSPGAFMRAMVFLTQGIFFNFFWVSYLIKPKFCHRLVGYLEEEAVVTYTKILKEIDGGELKAWKTTPAPEIAKKYWSLPEDATLADVVIHVRADEAHHRDVNHTLAELKDGDLNPFRDGHA